ncbi:LysR substrate-binding domain-containing protein [Thiorhodovibrio litoralis]|nr:LysR substrate-binding domain-containing protein [Thiorhodovibrio litoralis]WPL12942.1 Cys regulon transcriptional activator [Thiorhodovibrio litoralis]
MMINDSWTSGSLSFATTHTPRPAMPCHRWNRCVAAPTGHPILEVQALTLEEIARWPIVTYDPAFTGRAQIDHAFSTCGVEPNVVLSAVDSDVIKTYVGMGLGIGILASMA